MNLLGTPRRGLLEPDLRYPDFQVLGTEARPFEDLDRGLDHPLGGEAPVGRWQGEADVQDMVVPPRHFEVRVVVLQVAEDPLPVDARKDREPVDLKPAARPGHTMRC
jgi:hypothetical protein